LKRRTCACTRCVKEAKPVVSSCMRCVVFVQLYEVSCMRYDVCVELYEVSCNKRLTLRPVAMFLLFCLWLHASLTSHTHSLSLSLAHTHTLRGQVPFLHYAGNFWWTTCSRVRKLEVLKLSPKPCLPWRASVETDHLFCYAVPAHHTLMLVFDVGWRRRIQGMVCCAWQDPS